MSIAAFLASIQAINVRGRLAGGLASEVRMYVEQVKKAASSLWDTGLTEEILREVIKKGESFRDHATAFSPLNKAGFYAWAETVEALRHHLVPKGWVVKRDHGLESLVSGCGRHEILVVSGDGYTDSQEPYCVPQPKRPRGQATEFAVDRSQGTLDLFSTAVSLDKHQGPTLWMLLVHRVKTAAQPEVRAEISIPGYLTDTGFVQTWHHRHSLGTIALGAPQQAEIKDDMTPSESTVEVKRKS